jgi:hypothetical protein
MSLVRNDAASFENCLSSVRDAAVEAQALKAKPHAITPMKFFHCRFSLSIMSAEGFQSGMMTISRLVHIGPSPLISFSLFQPLRRISLLIFFPQDKEHVSRLLRSNP